MNKWYRIAFAMAVLLVGVSFGILTRPVLAVAGTQYLYRGETLTQGQSLISPNGQNWVTMQSDGNLVIYAEGNPVAPWSTNTQGHFGAYAVMQADGNFVVYPAGGSPALWQSHTYGSNPGAYVAMQNDGNLVIYNYPPLGQPQPLWWTGTTSTWHVGPVRQMSERFEVVTAVVQAIFQWNYHNVYLWGSVRCNVSNNGPAAVGTTPWCDKAGNGSNQYMNAGMNAFFIDFMGNSAKPWDRMNTDINGQYWTTSGYNWH